MYQFHEPLPSLTDLYTCRLPDAYEGEGTLPEGNDAEHQAMALQPPSPTAPGTESAMITFAASARSPMTRPIAGHSAGR